MLYLIAKAFEQAGMKLLIKILKDSRMEGSEKIKDVEVIAPLVKDLKILWGEFLNRPFFFLLEVLATRAVFWGILFCAIYLAQNTYLPVIKSHYVTSLSVIDALKSFMFGMHEKVFSVSVQDYMNARIFATYVVLTWIGSLLLARESTGMVRRYIFSNR